jgi:hypothetical protein
MRYIFTIIFMISAIISSQAQCDSATSLYWQNFEGATPANGPSGWITKGVDYTQAGFTGFNSTNRVGLNATTDTVITSPQVCPSQIDFYWRSSGASSVWTVHIQYSTDLSTWVTLDSVKVTGSGAPTSYTYKSIPFPFANLAPPFAVYIRFNMVLRTSGACYIDNLCLSKGVCHAVASQVQFTNSTSNCVPSNIPFSATVCATDANSYVDTTFNGPITVALGSGSGTLGGTTTKQAVAGCATFNNLTFSGAAPLSLNASAIGLSNASPLTTLDIQSTCPNVDTLSVVSYNLLNYPRGGQYSLGGACSPQETNKFRVDTLAAIFAYMKPDIMIVQELQTQGGADSILSHAININGVTKYAMAPYIPNGSTANVNYNNECYYNTDKLVLYQGTTIPTSIRDVGVYKFYLKDPLLNLHNDTTWLDMYSIHTKAKGLGAAQATLDSIQRANDCQRAMDSIRARQSSERNAIIGGDMNLYTSNEGAFIAFTSGLYKFNDPVNQPGAWESNIAFAPLHTQAARSGSRLSLECGARGGLDSRLDFLLNTDPITNGTQHITYIPNTYTAFGNDRMLFNRSVDSNAAASSIPLSILQKLANMSDHIPVVEKLAVQYPNVNPLGINEIKLVGQIKKHISNLEWDKVDKVSSYIIYRDGQYYATTTQVSFTDNNMPLGTHTYRIKAKLDNGNYIYSNTISLARAQLSDYVLSPNPAAGYTTLFAAAKQIADISIYSLTGTQVLYMPQVVLQGNGVQINTQQLPNGNYVVKIHNGTSISNIRLVVAQ